jgi:hypothetical protein
MISHVQTLMLLVEEVDLLSMASASFRSSRHGGREVLVADWRDAEELAVWHLGTTLALRAVRTTGAGADGGVDVEAPGLAAQVKFWAQPVGAPELQQLVGAALGRVTVFYSLQGYTQQALRYAEAAQVALFEFSVYGDVVPVNEFAHLAVRSRASVGNDYEAAASAEAAYRASRHNETQRDPAARARHSAELRGRVARREESM